MIYRDLHVSLMRFCKEFAETQNSEDAETVFLLLDGSWDEAELPRSDFVGPLGLTFEFDGQFIDGNVQIGFSTSNDKNLFRLIDRVGKLSELLRPMTRLKIYDAESGQLKGQMLIKNGTRVMPVAGSKGRPVQMVAISFTTTITYELPSDIVNF